MTKGLQGELTQITGVLNFRVNTEVSETLQQWSVMSEKCSAVWVLGLVSVGAVASV